MVSQPVSGVHSGAPPQVLAAGRTRLALGESARLQILAWWAGSRLLIFALALAIQEFGWARGGWRPGLLKHPFALLTTWDSRWYATIAERGYLLIPGRTSDPAFFPLFPVLLRGLHQLGLSVLGAGLVVANAGFLVGVLALYELARTWLDERQARRAAVYATVFPAGFVFSMAYPEGLVLAALALAGVYALRERWLACALCAATAALARPEGVFVALPIAAVVLERWPRLGPRARAGALAAALAPLAALASFPVYLWAALGDPLAWSEAQRAWGRAFAPTGLGSAVAHLFASHQPDPWVYRDLLFFLLYVGCLALARRAGVPRAWVAASTLMVLLPLGSGSFVSETRFGLLALPVYFGLATLGESPSFDRAFRLAAPLLLAAEVFAIGFTFP